MDQDDLIRAELYDPAAPDPEERLALVEFLATEGLTVDEMAVADREGRLIVAAAERMLRGGAEQLTLADVPQRAGVLGELATLDVPLSEVSRGSSPSCGAVPRGAPPVFLVAGGGEAGDGPADLALRGVALRGGPDADEHAGEQQRPGCGGPGAVLPSEGEEPPSSAMDPPMAAHMTSRGLAGVRRRFMVRGSRCGGV